MANIYGRSTATFNPYSFEEMLKPALMATEAHNKLEEEYANLEVLTADVADKLSNNPKDAKLKTLYDQFNTKLQEASNALNNYGLNGTTRKDLARLKVQYAKDINPINNAYKRMVEYNDTVNKMSYTHPEMVVEGKYTVSDFMGGNTPIPIVANKDTIYTKSMNAAKGTSSRFNFIDNPSSVLGNQYFRYKSGQGITQDAIKELNSYINSGKALQSAEGQALYNIVMEQRRANNYDAFSKAGKDQIDASILNGIFAGTSYTEDVKYMADQSYMNDLEKLKYKMALDKAKTDDGKSGIDQDYRGAVGVYKGDNADISHIIDRMKPYEVDGKLTPIVTKDGTTLENAMEAYNYIHEYDSKIKDLNKTLKSILGTTTKDREFTLGTIYNPKQAVGIWQTSNGNIEVSYEFVNNLFKERDALEEEYKVRKKTYEDFSLSDKEVERLRQYHTKEDGSFYSGLLTQDEMVSLYNKAGGDISTMISGKDDATIIASKEYGRLDDIVDTLQTNLESYSDFTVYDNNGKPIKKERKVPEFITGDKGNVSRIELDFKSFNMPEPCIRVKLEGGDSYNIPISYLGSGINNKYLTGNNNIKNNINTILKSNGDKNTKLNAITSILRGVASGIQTDFSTNIEQSLSITNKDRANVDYSFLFEG